MITSYMVFILNNQNKNKKFKLQHKNISTKFQNQNQNLLSNKIETINSQVLFGY